MVAEKIPTYPPYANGVRESARRVSRMPQDRKCLLASTARWCAERGAYWRAHVSKACRLQGKMPRERACNVGVRTVEQPLRLTGGTLRSSMAVRGAPATHKYEGMRASIAYHGQTPGWDLDEGNEGKAASRLRLNHPEALYFDKRRLAVSQSIDSRTTGLCRHCVRIAALVHLSTSRYFSSCAVVTS